MSCSRLWGLLLGVAFIACLAGCLRSESGSSQAGSSHPRTTAPEVEASRKTVLASSASAAGAGTAQPSVIRRIGFGSCLRQDRPAPTLERLVADEPDLVILLGDNVYADTRDPAVLRTCYEMLAARPDFQALRRRAPLLATWDDHDYGENDAGAEFPLREGSQEILLDFLAVPPDSPRRARAGVYHARSFGPPGFRVQVILLDTRSHRSPLERLPKRPPGRGPYVPRRDPEATMLGAEQWQWLAEQLATPAELRIVASSIQLLADQHGWECWGNLPHQRERFLELVATQQAAGVIVLSGDRHHAEISCLPPGEESPLSYPLYDVTASSLNQGRSSVDEPNRHRVGQPYAGANYGRLDVDWDEGVVTFVLLDAGGMVVSTDSVRLAELGVQGR